MLGLLSAIAKKLYWSKPIAVALGLLCVGLFLLSVFGLGDFDSKVLLIPSLLGGLWSALYFILLTMFPAVPPRPRQEVKFFAKLKIYCQRGMYFLLGLILIAVTVVIIFLSFKLLIIWGADVS